MSGFLICSARVLSSVSLQCQTTRESWQRESPGFGNGGWAYIFSTAQILCDFGLSRRPLLFHSNSTFGGLLCVFSPTSCGRIPLLLSWDKSGHWLEFTMVLLDAVSRVWYRPSLGDRGESRSKFNIMSSSSLYFLFLLGVCIKDDISPLQNKRRCK